MSIYVEILIRGPMEELWRLTQTPELHEQWDLRFTTIAYLPRPNDDEPQQFLYETRIGLGTKICGGGESVGSRNEGDGSRTSALKFWSDDPKSLIREGAGYWQYIPTPAGIRFLTSYDYRVRFGRLGQVLDALAFRPLMGWATAWSFDRLRLWIEKGVHPASSLRLAALHMIATCAVAIVWIYQGAVPKLLTRNGDELAMLLQAGVPSELTALALQCVGWSEVLLGVLTLALWRKPWMFAVTIALMLCAAVAVTLKSPHYLSAAFNPISLNLLMASMALVGWLTCRDLPSARRCLRIKPA